MTYYTELGRALRECRRACDMTQAHVGRLLGVGQGAVCRIEGGRHKTPGHLTMAYLALVTARAPNELVGAAWKAALVDHRQLFLPLEPEDPSQQLELTA